MSVNAANLALTHEQSASLMNAIVQQASGQSVLAQINTGDFVSVATTALRNGYDPIIGAISQVLGRTIVSIRPYAAKLAAMRVTSEQWGAMTRKINFIDREVVNDDRLSPMVDGTDYSPYTVRKPRVVETKWYGDDSYEDYVTIFRDQLDSAFTGTAQFGAFVTGLLQALLDKLEQYRENQSRVCLVNLIGSTLACETTNGANGRVIHLLSEFAADSGASSTPTWASIVGDAAQMFRFRSWLAGKLKSTVRRMGERSTLFHELPIEADASTKMALMRHTSPERMRAYMLSDYWDVLDNMADTGIFHEDLLARVPYEGTSYWQSINSPASIDASVAYFRTVESGQQYNDTAEAQISEDAVFGVIFDEDAAGITEVNNWAAATPMNPKKGFYNQFYHIRSRMVVDNTENCVVLLMD